MSSLESHVCGHCERTFERRQYQSHQPPKYCSRACRDAARSLRVTVACDRCGKLHERKQSRVVDHNFCSKACFAAMQPEMLKGVRSGSDNVNWKGGVIHRNGYRFIKMPEHPMARGSGYIAEHRLVMAEHLGRLLRPDELVHHINGVKDDNRVENLEVVASEPHSRTHRLQKAQSLGWNLHGHCQECGSTEQRHWAKGLCQRCYLRGKARAYYRAKKQANI